LVTPSELIARVRGEFSRIYLRGIPSLLTDEGAFLSFICTFTAIEALSGFARPKEKKNGTRFKEFVRDYFPEPYPSHADNLWKLRNALVHAFSPGPYALTHHHSEVHFTMQDGRYALNAEDFFGTLLVATQQYFSAVTGDTTLQAAFVERADDTGVMIVKTMP